MAKRTQHVPPNNVAIRCVDMLRLFDRGFTLQIAANCCKLLQNAATKVNLSYFYSSTFIWESTKHGPLVHGPPLWTRSMDLVHQNMDRVHGPPPIFPTPKNTIENNKKIKELN